MTRPLVIAHRGASGERPENTLSAYDLALEQHADMIEIDLHLTRDGVVVIHHDAVLDRLGAEGEIADHLAVDLARLDAAPGIEAIERMPTLLDVLDGYGSAIEFNLELKVGTTASYEGLEEIAVREVAARGLMPRMLFSSFYDPVLERLRAMAPSARIGVLVSPRVPHGILERAAAVAAEAIHPHVALVDERLVESAHVAGLKVYPYTEDDPAEMTRLLDLGVDGIITNHPARLRDLLADRDSEDSPSNAAS